MTNTNVLSRTECMKMLQSQGTPNHVVAHCIAVSDVAKQIALSLNRKGFHLDVDLVEAAGLLHDMARTRENHWDVAADFLLAQGHFREAEIIKVHMHHHFPENPLLSTETDMVCLADRLVLENQYVGLEKRMDYIIKKAGEHQDVIIRIEKNKALVGDYISQLEVILGTSIDALVREFKENEQ